MLNSDHEILDVACGQISLPFSVIPLLVWSRGKERSEGKSLRDSGLVYGFVDGSCCILTVLPVLNPSFVIALGAQDMTKRQNLH